MKKLLSVLICFGLFGLVMTLSACGGVDLYMYIFAGEYSKITQNLTLDNVKELEINWLAGELKIVSGDVEKITLTESGDRAEDKPGYYRLREDGHLNIEYFKSGEVRDHKVIKNLTITVPQNFNFINIEVKSTYGDIILEGISSDEMKLTHSNGNGLVRNCQGGLVKIVTSTGSFEMLNSTVEGILTLNPNEGTMDITSCNVRDYKVYTYKGVVTLTIPDEAFLLDLRDYGTCNHEDFDLVESTNGKLVYGEESEVLHNITFESTHRAAVLNLIKSVV